MTLGMADKQGDLFDDVVRFCEETLPERSIYSFLARERDHLFPDEAFADLFDDRGRASVPPSVVATVMVLQRLEGLSDREAVDRYCFDNRWRYAAGAGGYDTNAWTSFSHTVLVDMRMRLRASANPNRIFDAALRAAKEAGLIGSKRALDSTPLYDAVATMDTITLIRSAIRGLMKVAERELEIQLRAVLVSGDDYATSAKPTIDWDDPAAREELIDSRAKDAYACLLVLDSRELDPVVCEAAKLLATVVGQDLEEGDDGVFRIARKVAKDRVISMVDPEARHGHKSAARGFDGYKGHVAVDPDSEIVTATVVTPGNAGDAYVAEDLIGDLLDEDVPESREFRPGETSDSHRKDRPTVYGDNAYGTGPFHERLEDSDIESKCKTQRPTTTGNLFTKDCFIINLDDDTVICPNGVTVEINLHSNGGGTAHFADGCQTCPLRTQCTKAATGRTISISPHEDVLARARVRQGDPGWIDDYRSTRPKVERKVAHLMFRKHGGRRARMRGTEKVAADFSLLAAAANLRCLATLGSHFKGGMWATTGSG